MDGLDFSSLLSMNGLIALFMLVAMEIVLGIDNIIFIAILADKLPPEQRRMARLIGLSLAMIMRLVLLFFIKWILELKGVVFTLAGEDFSWKDLILIAGGLFLIYKATMELHDKVEGSQHAVPQESSVRTRGLSFSSVIIQILLLDMVFSIDSILTAVGMVDEISIMVLAVVLSVGVMLVASGPIVAVIGKHPTLKVLALSFLLLIGVTLVADGMGRHIEKGYVYFAMAFSVGVETFNLLYVRDKSKDKLEPSI